MELRLLSEGILQEVLDGIHPQLCVLSPEFNGLQRSKQNDQAKRIHQPSHFEQDFYEVHSSVLVGGGPRMHLPDFRHSVRKVSPGLFDDCIQVLRPLSPSSNRKLSAVRLNRFLFPMHLRVLFEG